MGELSGEAYERLTSDQRGIVMKHAKLLKYLVVLALVFLASCECVPPQPDGGQITIASFNIQVFGQTKASKLEVMEILADITRQYDIVAIREIWDAAGTAILALRDKVNENGAAYSVVTGPRVGRTYSKEQYAFMCDTTILKLLPGGFLDALPVLKTTG